MFEQLSAKLRWGKQQIERFLLMRPVWLNEKVRFYTAEQVEHLFRVAPQAALGTLLAALLMGYFVWFFGLPLQYLVVWVSLHLGVAGLRVWLIWCYRRVTASQVHPDYEYWLGIKEIVVFLYALAWSSPVLVLSGDSDPLLIHAILISLVGVAGASILHATIIFSVYVFFVVPILLSFVLWGVFNSNALYQLYGVMLALYAVYMTTIAYISSRNNYLLIQKSKALNDSQLELIRRLSKAGEFRDNETNEHVSRMSYGCYLLALKAGYDKAFAEAILFTSPMHDIGKIAIPDSILLKPGKLNDEERLIMQRHVLYGKELLQGESPLMKMATNIAECHHESWDGGGYPSGLHGDAIPVEARITTICDVFDALISKRPYKEAWPVERALNYIEGMAGKQLDPQLVKHFLEIVPEILSNNQMVNDKMSSSGNAWQLPGAKML